MLTCRNAGSTMHGSKRHMCSWFFQLVHSLGHGASTHSNQRHSSERKKCAWAISMPRTTIICFLSFTLFEWLGFYFLQRKLTSCRRYKARGNDHFMAGKNHGCPLLLCAKNSPLSWVDNSPQVPFLNCPFCCIRERKLTILGWRFVTKRQCSYLSIWSIMTHHIPLITTKANDGIISATWLSVLIISATWLSDYNYALVTPFSLSNNHRSLIIPTKPTIGSACRKQPETKTRTCLIMSATWLRDYNYAQVTPFSLSNNYHWPILPTKPTMGSAAASSLKPK